VDLAAANQQVFVRIPGGCVALDMEDLSLMWQAVSATLPRPSQIPDPRRLNLQNATVRISGPYTEDPTNKQDFHGRRSGIHYRPPRHGRVSWQRRSAGGGCDVHSPQCAIGSQR
jgi:hypothetical protein